jgi:K+-sensing histidine kinase KdpD
MNRDECPHLLSLAVHEFRTPVTVIAGYVRMLLKLYGGSLGDQPRKLLEETEKSCIRLSGLIADLSNMQAGHVSFERQPLDFCGTVEEVATGVHEAPDRDVRLRVERPAENLMLTGDRARLGQAIESLLMATLRERADPGTVLARCSRAAPAHAALVIAPEGSEEVTAPFDPSDWAPFDLFRGGLGFRLQAAHAIVAAHGGAIYSGRGSSARGTCALLLPLEETAR